MNNTKKNRYFVCKNCKTSPCKFGCPLGNDIPKFIKYLKEKNYQKAYFILSKTTLLPSLCGRVCPQDTQCERMCKKVLDNNFVKIGDLEATLGDIALKNNFKVYAPKKTKHKVLVIGSGPSSLTCAGFLRRNGINVTIVEKHDYLGGLLIHGIPDFRLEKNLVKSVVDNIVNLGIEVIYNQELGKDFQLDDVINKYDAIFIGCGTNISNKLNIPGEDLLGAYGGNELLEEKIQLDNKKKNVVIIGCGNTAMDIARTLKNQGFNVNVLYRGSEDTISASPDEYEDTKKHHVKFIFNTNILKICGTNQVESIEVIKTKSQIDENNKEKLINIPDSNYLIKCDYVIKSIGSRPDKNLLDTFNLNLNEKGYIDIDGNGRTSNPKIFAGGDIAGIKSTVAWAARSGRNAAYQIIEDLKSL